jgi:branched-chain amino acid transport system substrate-binding protein
MKQLAKRLSPIVIAASLACGAVSVHAQEVIKMGALATLEGAFTVLGQDGIRGVELALKERNYMAGGKSIELVKGSSNVMPDSPSAPRASWWSRTRCKS